MFNFQFGFNSITNTSQITYQGYCVQVEGCHRF